ncbi:MAG: type II toxin-antitoxin system VapC family toxin [bacterium]|nr:type II toxin-antitoxin system VapC family toxin [bacterium]MDT8394955.1 type II toxin-antitoxin system VapC family toxin [bacterium]
MARFVVEPSLVVKWFVPEDHSNAAARLLDGGNELLAPDTLLTEAARLLTAKTRLGELTQEESLTTLEALQAAPLCFVPASPLMEAALRIATSLDRPLGDGLSLALAVQSDCRLVTTSRTLYDIVRGTPFSVHVKWVGDLR